MGGGLSRLNFGACKDKIIVKRLNDKNNNKLLELINLAQFLTEVNLLAVKDSLFSNLPGVIHISS